MAQPNPLNIIKAGARVVIDPTNLAGAYPYGGTPLGNFAGVQFRPHIRTRQVTAEEYGGQTSNVVFAGEGAILVGVVRDFDVDTVTAMYPNAAPGGSGSAVVSSDLGSGATLPGTMLQAVAAVVLLAAREPTNPSVILYNAMPVVDEQLQAAYSVGAEMGMAVSWVATPDSQSRTWKWGRLEDLSL